MKLVTQKYIDGINGISKKTAKITYDDNGTTIILDGDKIFNIALRQNTDILRAVMKELEFVSIDAIPLETNINFKYGVYTTNDYEYVDYGNFIVLSCEKQEDANNYKILAYDNMLKAKVEYKTLQNGTFPMTIRSYINNLCTDLGLVFANASNTFANYNKTINSDIYADLGYNYFDIFNELAQVTASNIVINDENKLSLKYIDIEHKNKLNIYDGFDLGYINAQNVYVPDDKNALFKQKISVTAGTKYTFSVSQTIDNMVVTVYDASDNFITRSKSSNVKAKTYTMPNNASYVKLAINYNDSSTMTEEIILSLKPMVEIGNAPTSYVSYVPTINEDYLKSYNVSTKEVYGPVNTIVLTRSAGSDSVYYPTTLPENPYELKIEDNQIMNFDDRDTYLPDIYAKLNGLQFYTNDYETYGITYLDLCDRYNLKVNNLTYPCLMLNTELINKDGTDERVYTYMPNTSSTKYDTSSASDRLSKRTSLIVDKQNNSITALTGIVDEDGQLIDGALARLTNAEATLNIVSTNIDQDTGDVISVKTTRGYTFDADGLKISSEESSFNSLSNNVGTYYKDNDIILSQFTKDNIIMKDMVLYGKYYYGVDDELIVENFTKDDAMFVAEKFVNDNNEEIFGHFYNGD